LHFPWKIGKMVKLPIQMINGSWGTEGLKLIKAIGKKVIEVTGEKRSTSFISQSISMAIMRGNANCVLGTVPHSEGLDEIYEFVSTES